MRNSHPGQKRIKHLLSLSLLARAFIKRYYTRPEFELVDLEKDPLELNNLAGNPEYRAKLMTLMAELARWTGAQGDTLLPHRDPYPVASPLPTFKSRARKT
jgi:uncharacterized sulfatase